MTTDTKQFALTAALALKTYAANVENSYWDIPDPEDMVRALPLIARFLETIFEDGERD